MPRPTRCVRTPSPFPCLPTACRSCRARRSRRRTTARSAWTPSACATSRSTGPRQRPDMAFSRVFDCMENDRPFRLLGNGRQSRDFTYVGDIVDATIAAMAMGTTGDVYNVGGGSEISLLDALTLCERVAGRQLQVAARRGGDRRRAPHDRRLSARPRRSSAGARRRRSRRGCARRPAKRSASSRSMRPSGTRSRSSPDASLRQPPRGRPRRRARDPVVPPPRGRRRAPARAARAAARTARRAQRGDHPRDGGGAARGAHTRLDDPADAASRGSRRSRPGVRRRGARAPAAASFSDRPRPRPRRAVPGHDRTRRPAARPALPRHGARAPARPATSRASRASRSAACARGCCSARPCFAALSTELREELIERGVPPERVLTLPERGRPGRLPARRGRRAPRPARAPRAAARGVRRHLRRPPAPGQGRGHAARRRRPRARADAGRARRRSRARPARGAGRAARPRGASELPRRAPTRCADFLRASDAFLLSSHGEGMSNALLEGMACGLPCLVSRSVGGAAELLGEGRGVPLPDGDPEAWAAALRELVADPRLRERTGSAAAAYVAETLSLEAAADRLADAYAIARPREPARSLSGDPLPRGHRDVRGQRVAGAGGALPDGAGRAAPQRRGAGSPRDRARARRGPIRPRRARRPARLAGAPPARLPVDARRGAARRAALLGRRGGAGGAGVPEGGRGRPHRRSATGSPTCTRTSRATRPPPPGWSTG